MSFKDLNLNKPILRAIAEAGYNEPTLVQEKTIPLVLNKKDVIFDDLRNLNIEKCSTTYFFSLNSKN